MKTNEKKSLFTAVSEEQSATVCGGVDLTVLLQSLSNSGTQVVVNNDPSTTVDTAGNLTSTIGGLTFKIGLLNLGLF